MSILNRIRQCKEQRAYEREVLWRQRTIPYGRMLGQTIAYQRRVEPSNIEATQKQKVALELMKEEVRAAFLSHPAATEEDFSRCWPILRDEIFRKHTLNTLESGQVSSIFELVGDR